MTFFLNHVYIYMYLCAFVWPVSSPDSFGAFIFYYFIIIILILLFLERVSEVL